MRERNNNLRTKLSHSKTFSGQEDNGGRGSATYDREALLEEARQLKTELSDIERREGLLHTEMEDLALQLPNITSVEAPLGDQAKIIGYINQHPEPESVRASKVWRSHVNIGGELGLLDFEAAATTSGWGWYYLTNEAHLQEILITLMPAQEAEIARLRLVCFRFVDP